MGLRLRDRIYPGKIQLSSDSQPLWVHCASVGEFNTFKPILRELRRRYPVVLTYFSPRAEEFLSSGSTLYDALYPLPLDLPPLIRRFESIVRPRAIIIVERELWPSLLMSTRSKKILVNAYAKESFLERLLVRKYSLILARSEEDRELFEREGAKRVVVCGNLKLVQEGSPEKIELGIGEECRLLVGGSTREGEEELLLRLFAELRSSFPLKLVLAPRHVERAEEVHRLAQSMGFKTSRWSSPDPKWEVLIVDTLGKLRSFYELADVTFVGGTFSSVGGHNLIEPAYLGKPVVFGPRTHKVKDMEELLLKEGYGFRAENYGELKRIVEKLLREGFRPARDLKSHSVEVKRCYLENLLAEL